MEKVASTGAPFVELPAGDNARDPVQDALAELRSMGAMPLRAPD
jgi:hypothetical protein